MPELAQVHEVESLYYGVKDGRINLRERSGSVRTAAQVAGHETVVLLSAKSGTTCFRFNFSGHAGIGLPTDAGDLCAHGEVLSRGPRSGFLTSISIGDWKRAGTRLKARASPV